MKSYSVPRIRASERARARRCTRRRKGLTRVRHARARGCFAGLLCAARALRTRSKFQIQFPFATGGIFHYRKLLTRQDNTHTRAPSRTRLRRVARARARARIRRGITVIFAFFRPSPRRSRGAYMSNSECSWRISAGRRAARSLFRNDES